MKTQGLCELGLGLGVRVMLDVQTKFAKYLDGNPHILIRLTCFMLWSIGINNVRLYKSCLSLVVLHSEFNPVSAQENLDCSVSQHTLYAQTAAILPGVPIYKHTRSERPLRGSGVQRQIKGRELHERERVRCSQH